MLLMLNKLVVCRPGLYVICRFDLQQASDNLIAVEEDINSCLPISVHILPSLSRIHHILHKI